LCLRVRGRFFRDSCWIKSWDSWTSRGSLYFLFDFQLIYLIKVHNNTTIVLWLFLFHLTQYHSHSSARRSNDIRVTTSSVSGFGDDHSCARVLTWNSALRNACISDSGLPASHWRFFFLPCISGYWSARAVIVLVLIKEIDDLLRRY